MRALIFVVLLLAGCATAIGTPYAPADKKGYGYTDTQIEANRFRVTFAGDGATPPQVVEDFALLRAAELALANGYDWLRVIYRDTQFEEKGGVGLGAGFGTGSYGRHSGVDVGVGGNLGTVGARKFYTTRMEVLFGKGAKPEGDDAGEVYDARSVADTIRTRIDAADAPS